MFTPVYWWFKYNLRLVERTFVSVVFQSNSSGYKQDCWLICCAGPQTHTEAYIRALCLFPNKQAHGRVHRWYVLFSPHCTNLLCHGDQCENKTVPEHFSDARNAPMRQVMEPGHCKEHKWGFSNRDRQRDMNIKVCVKPRDSVYPLSFKVSESLWIKSKVCFRSHFSWACVFTFEWLVRSTFNYHNHQLETYFW